MKLILFLSAIVITGAIRVPSSWQNKENKRRQRPTTGDDPFFNIRPPPDLRRVIPPVTENDEIVSANNRFINYISNSNWLPVIPPTTFKPRIKQSNIFLRPKKFSPAIITKRYGLPPYSSKIKSSAKLPFVPPNFQNNPQHAASRIFHQNPSKFVGPHRPIQTSSAIQPKVVYDPFGKSIHRSSHQVPYQQYPPVRVANANHLQPQFVRNQLYGTTPIQQIQPNEKKLRLQHPSYNVYYPMQNPQRSAASVPFFEEPRYHKQSPQVFQPQPSVINSQAFQPNNLDQFRQIPQPAVQAVAPQESSFFENFQVDQFLKSQGMIPPTSSQHHPLLITQPQNFVNQIPSIEHHQSRGIPINHKPHYTNVRNNADARNVLHNNYRDDRTHEPSGYDPERDEEDAPELERQEVEELPVSNHAQPQEIPTKPIYPGEGQWAKRRTKHKPFVSNHKFENLEENKERPDGYETFERGEKLYDHLNDKFFHNLQELPQENELGKFTEENSSEEEQVADGDREEAEDDEFVPSKLLAQVRRSENEEHLPAEEDENGRLKELVKDSKVQTVYTEEGYEDSAYDHAGHEKNAENDEGFQESDREIESEEEKKAPKKRKPKKETIKYSSGDRLYTDEEIETFKKENLDLGEEEEAEEEHAEDSDSAGSYKEVAKLNLVSPGEESSTKEKPRTKLKKTNKHDFISTKETKLTTTKDKGDGLTEMEVLGDVEVISQPYDGKQSQKYFKRYPRIYKTSRSRDDVSKGTSEDVAEVEQIYSPADATKTDFFIEEIITTSDPSETTTVEPTSDAEIVTLKVSKSADATTEIYKQPPSNKINLPVKIDKPEALENIDQAFSSINSKTRRKRFTNDFPTIDVDSEFISKFNQQIVEKPKEDVTQFKYPYYHKFEEFGINENSPLRYSENLANIPVKRENNMAFYEQAESRVPCPAIASTVDPIPERVLNAENENEDESDLDDDTESEGTSDSNDSDEEDVPQPKLPRLSGLGDKIDCFKVRYFGENPLDSPFFQEELVGPVKPVFNFVPSSPVSEPNTISSETKSTSDLLYQPNESRMKIQIPETNEVISSSDESPENEIYSSKEDDRENEIDYKSLHQDYVEERVPGHISYPHNKENIKKAKSSDISKNYSPKTRTDSTESNYNTSSISSPSKPPTMAPISLLTTPKYTIDLKPKHIYDQIDLLRYLPERMSEVNETQNRTESFVDVSDVNGTEISNLPNTNETQKLLVILKLNINDRSSQPNFRTSKEINNVEAFPNNDNSKIVPDLKEIKYQHPKTTYQVFDVNKYLPTTPLPIFKDLSVEATTPINENAEELPDSEALKRRRRIRIRHPRPTYQVFDINQYLPTTPFPIFNDLLGQSSNGHSTILPKYKVVSEVFYKDDIKPNEQLQVFTDVLNTIKISSEEQRQDSINKPSESFGATDNVLPITSDEGNRYHLKKINAYPQDSYLKAYGDSEVEYDYHSTTSKPITTLATTIRPTRKILKYVERKAQHPTFLAANMSKVKTFENGKQGIHLFMNDAKRKLRVKTTTKLAEVATPAPVVDDNVEESTEIVGMIPPRSHIYKSIYNPKRDNSQSLSAHGKPEIIYINKFIVPGMKPPPKQRILVYADYLNMNHLRNKRGPCRRSKRSTSRASYAQLSRRKSAQEVTTAKVETTTEKVDDYVPHRPKNYYYDEKTKKIVYLTTSKPKEEESESEIEEIEYVDVEEESSKTTHKPKQSPIFATAKPPPEGQSYIDFVKKLKSDANYISIPDPTTTEKSEESIKETTTTRKPESTTPPEFLNILAKVRGNSEYKFIEEKTTKAPTNTKLHIEVEEATENEEEDKEETQLDNVQNSPGGQGFNGIRNLEIFDINDYVPKLKNYLPKTSIDLSRYKTIERPKQRTEDSNEGETDKAEKEADEDSVPMNSDKNIQENEKGDEVMEANELTSTTTKASTTAGSKNIHISRRRQRLPTTLRVARTTVKETPTTAIPQVTQEAEVIHHEKARRTYRKRPIRIRPSTTTVKYIDEEVDDTTKIIRRRSGKHEDILEVTENPEDVDSNVEQEVLSTTILVDLPAQQRTDVKKSVEVFKKYDRSKKHGGNYRKEPGRAVPIQYDEVRQQMVDKDSATMKSRDIEIVSEYNKSKQHGGNYRSEEQDDIEVKPKSEEHYDKSETHNDSEVKPSKQRIILNIPGAPKTNSIQDILNQDDEVEVARVQKIEGPKVKPKPKPKSFNRKPVRKQTERTRWTDVVPNPESFFTDPNLPLAVNMLMDGDLASREVASIVKDKEEEIESARDKTNQDGVEISSETTTEKPLYIKDPNKRLYFYAPI